MSGKGQLLQDPFLNVLRKEHIPVSIYLVNGIKLQGQIEAFQEAVFPAGVAAGINRSNHYETVRHARASIAG